MAPKEYCESDIRPTGILQETDVETIDGSLVKPEERSAKKRKFELVWRNIIGMSILHLMALYGAWLLVSGRTKWQTNLFGKYLMISLICSYL